MLQRWLVVVSCCALFQTCSSNEYAPVLGVTITLSSDTVSKCVQLTASAGSTERRTMGMIVGANKKLGVAVAQTDLPDTVTLEAEGFSDEGCQTLSQPAERSGKVEAKFEKNKIVAVNLNINRIAPVEETNCSDGIDNDEDTLKDCLDPDCELKSCTSGNVCQVGQQCSNGTCGGGSARQCTSPPNTACYLSPGSCQMSDGGCQYSVRTNGQCEDNDECTVNDNCGTSGLCKGVPKVCNTRPSQCYLSTGTCNPDGGTCSYSVMTGATCSDGDTCTLTDSCAADGTCTGTRVTCAVIDCKAPSGSCQDDGGCNYVSLDAGASCSNGGVCNAESACIPKLPFPPTNFGPAQVPTPTSVAINLNCGISELDTSTGATTNWCNQADPKFAIITQTGGSQAMLFSLTSLNVAAGAELIIKGSLPAILFATGAVTVSGKVTVSAGNRTCGLGAGNQGDTTNAGNGGAGGAGFGSQGGNGGAGAGPTAGGAGGAAAASTTLSPLIGGCQGGRGGESAADFARGGGALQIYSATTLSISGSLTAPGAGGAGGPSGIKPVAGNGGGSGGALLLEAKDITLVDGATLAANGGSGGEGGSLTINGANGATGLTNANAAAGGSTVGAGGNGGNGGALAADAGAGEDENAFAGGGGGGGYGIIRINTSDGCTFTPGNITVSPAAQSTADAGCP